MTRILITADAVGGVWTYALDLARGLAPHGADTILALTGPAPSADQRRAAATIPSLTLIDTGLPLDWLVDTPEEVAEAGTAIARLATRERVDLVHLNTPALGAHEPFGRVPVVAAAHSCVASWWNAAATGPLPPAFRWRTQLHRDGLRAAVQTIAPTAAFAAQTHRLYGVRPTVIHNGRDAFAVLGTPMRDEAITVGRLWDKGKNARILDAAAARASTPLFAAGGVSGPNGDSIDFSHVRPLGHLSDAELGTRLAARPVFVSAALYEPFGLAVLEAAAAGCTLVLSDIPTFRELWDGVATFVAANDAPGFAAAIDALIGDRPARIAAGEAAKSRARRYTPAATAAATMALYRTLLVPAEAKAA